MKDWLKEHMLYVVTAGIMAIGGVIYFLNDNKEIISHDTVELLETHQTETLQEKGESKQQEMNKEQEKVMVDVKGQVKLPGVYHSNPGERVIDLIQRAGGLTENADESKVNFAEHVQDAMVIYIPAIGEEEVLFSGTSAMAAGIGASKGSEKSKINLNTADETQLQDLPGIGPAKASAIIEYRNTNGPFQAIEDLKNISGIGDKTFEKLKDLIVVN